MTINDVCALHAFMIWAGGVGGGGSYGIIKRKEKRRTQGLWVITAQSGGRRERLRKTPRPDVWGMFWLLQQQNGVQREERGGEGWMDEGWWAEGSEEQRNYTGLQIVRELSGLQRSAVCFTSQAHLSAWRSWKVKYFLRYRLLMPFTGTLTLFYFT